MAEALAVVNATARKYFKGAADLTVRRRLLLSLLEKKGRIKYNASGTTCTWVVKYDQPSVQSHGASGEYTFDENDLYRQVQVDWRGYVTTDRMDYKNFLMNKGQVALVDRYKQILPELRQTLEDHFHGEMYIDGNATGNANRLHGILSFMGDDGATVAADLIARPSDTYGGQSTVLGTEGGTWSSNATVSPNATLANDWPDGSGTANYDFFSPVLVNTSSTSWSTGSTEWEDNCSEILRRTTTWLTKNGGKTGKPSAFLLASNLWNGYQNYQEARFRNIIPHPEARDLGFPETLNQDGVMIKYEFDVPYGEFFGLNPYQMKLESLDSQLWGVRGPEYDIKSDAFLFKAGFFGNIHWQPKYFARGKAYA